MVSTVSLPPMRTLFFLPLSFFCIQAADLPNDPQVRWTEAEVLLFSSELETLIGMRHWRPALRRLQKDGQFEVSLTLNRTNHVHKFHYFTRDDLLRDLMKDDVKSSEVFFGFDSAYIDPIFYWSGHFKARIVLKTGKEIGEGTCVIRMWKEMRKNVWQVSDADCTISDWLTPPPLPPS